MNMNAMEIAAITVLTTAPGVPVFVSRRWIDSAGDADWDGLTEWLETKGSMLSGGEQRLIAACIALARVDLDALDPLDSEAVGRALNAAGATYRGNAAAGLDQMRRLGLLDEVVDALAGGDGNEALIARVRADERASRDAAWTALLAASRLAVLEHGTEILVNTHAIGACIGAPCPLHRRTSHSMRGFPQVWWADRHLMTRVCPHGVTHPDPDDPKARDSTDHQCDGCCA